MTENTTHTLCLLPEGLRIKVPHGVMISEAIKSAGIYLSLPCGGKGTCGHCIVIVDDKEVKSCGTAVDRDMEVVVPVTVRLTGQRVLTDFRLYKPEENKAPRVERRVLVLAEPDLENSISDASRLRSSLAELLKLPAESIRIETSCLTRLPDLLRKNKFVVHVNLFHDNGSVTVLSLSDGSLYGVAVDIGTTTVAVALCNLADGSVIETLGLPNPQAAYGADIISRIVYCEENTGGTSKLQNMILQTLSAAVNTLTRQAGIDSDDIHLMTVAANTVMGHFLLGLPTYWLRREPYVPTATEYPIIQASALGLPMLPEAPVLIVPGISSYVGGDITAGIIASGINRNGLNLLVDAGTNGEIVLAGEGFMVACSSSAGPAFEGWGITCGSRAVTGAIDNVYVNNGRIFYDVIGGGEPVSLCGSGLISLISALLEIGVVDRSGHFIEKEKRFELTPKVFITEDDILNLIRSKAAIYAGIHILTGMMEIETADIGHVCVSGGFGRSLNISRTIDIGMFPPLPEASFSYEGNSALAGALRILCDRTLNPEEVAVSVMNIELSANNDFMDEFVQACFLPHTDLKSFGI